MCGLICTYSDSFLIRVDLVNQYWEMGNKSKIFFLLRLMKPLQKHIELKYAFEVHNFKSRKA